jgi:hypothetical protein
MSLCRGFRPPSFGNTRSAPPLSGKVSADLGNVKGVIVRSSPLQSSWSGRPRKGGRGSRPGRRAREGQQSKYLIIVASR